jgi:uncharacterized membrane protein
MSEHHHDIFDNRRQFQLERIILFSDAVFAIVITLLVIEIKVPETSSFGMLNSHKLKEHLFELFPHFLGFVMSFFVIALFWTAHHRVFGYVINYDAGLLWINLLLLLSIAFLPFTTALVSEHGYLNLAYCIYSINLGLIGIMEFFLWLKISNPKNKLSVGLENRNLRRYGIARALTVSAIFFLGAVLCTINNSVIAWSARFLFFLIFPAIRIVKRIYRVK